jgi:hypothetical protein
MHFRLKCELLHLKLEPWAVIMACVDRSETVIQDKPMVNQEGRSWAGHVVFSKLSPECGPADP